MLAPSNKGFYFYSEQTSRIQVHIKFKMLNCISKVTTFLQCLLIFFCYIYITNRCKSGDRLINSNSTGA